jgi:hypothetical protein
MTGAAVSALHAPVFATVWDMQPSPAEDSSCLTAWWHSDCLTPSGKEASMGSKGCLADNRSPQEETVNSLRRGAGHGH